MILVDTSIWIEFLRANNEYVEEMEYLLENRKVITIEPVFAELLYGCRNEKEREIVISYWKIMDKIKFTEGSFINAGEYASKNHHSPLGIGLIDTILCKVTMENNYLIWTLDKKIIKHLEKRFLYK